MHHSCVYGRLKEVTAVVFEKALIAAQLTVLARDFRTNTTPVVLYRSVD